MESAETIAGHKIGPGSITSLQLVLIFPKCFLNSNPSPLDSRKSTKILWSTWIKVALNIKIPPLLSNVSIVYCNNLTGFIRLTHERWIYMTYDSWAFLLVSVVQFAQNPAEEFFRFRHRCVHPKPCHPLDQPLELSLSLWLRLTALTAAEKVWQLSRLREPTEPDVFGHIRRRRDFAASALEWGGRLTGAEPPGVQVLVGGLGAVSARVPAADAHFFRSRCRRGCRRRSLALPSLDRRTDQFRFEKFPIWNQGMKCRHFRTLYLYTKKISIKFKTNENFNKKKLNSKKKKKKNWRFKNESVDTFGNQAYDAF